MKFIIVILLQVPIVPGVVSTVIPGVRCVFVLVHLKPSTSKTRYSRSTHDQGPILTNLSTFSNQMFFT